MSITGTYLLDESLDYGSGLYPGYPPNEGFSYFYTDILYPSYTGNSRSGIYNTSGAYLIEDFTLDYYNKIIISIDDPSYGTISSPVNRTVSITSTYSTGVNLDSISLPVGIQFTDMPSLPFEIAKFSENTYTLQATVSGPAKFADESVQFNFSTETLYITNLSGVRAVLLGFRPTNTVKEILEFKTDIIQKRDGTEQRICISEYPRQKFQATFRIAQRIDLARWENLLSGWQGRTVIFPVWFEPMKLTQAVSPGDTTIYVNTTSYCDLRVGGLAALADDYEAVEALGIESFDSTSITFSGEVTGSYSVGQIVFPARPCVVRNATGARFKVINEDKQIELISTENKADIASSSGFPTLNSKPFLDGLNFINGGTMPTSSIYDYVTIDAGYGLFRDEQVWPIGKRAKVRGFKTLNRSSLWSLRQMLYHLKGRYKSFYLPSYFSDFEPTTNLVSTNAIMTVVNVGFSKNINTVSPYNRIRVTLKTGATIDRTINSAAEIDFDYEQLTLNSNWPYNVPISDILKVELIQLHRFDTDSIEIEHINDLGRANIFIPVINVIE